MRRPWFRHRVVNSQAPSSDAPGLVESLEPRRLFSAAPVAPAVDAHGVLQVAGTHGSDATGLSPDAADPAAVVVGVTVNGTTGPPSRSLRSPAASGPTGERERRRSGCARPSPAGTRPASRPLAGAAGTGMTPVAGGTDKDTPDGGDGDETLDGGRAKDAVTGGTGTDHFGAADGDSEGTDRDSSEVADAVLDPGHGGSHGHGND